MRKGKELDTELVRERGKITKERKMSKRWR